MVWSSSWALMPSPAEAAPWGSKSTMSVRRPYSARAAARLIVEVVLPTPPFWLAMAMMRAGPCVLSGAGTGKSSAAPSGLAPVAVWEISPGCSMLTPPR